MNILGASRAAVKMIPEVVPYLSDRARWMLKTYDEYYSRLWRAARRLFEGGRDANFLASFARSIDQQLTQAWNTGAADVGVLPDEMKPDDMLIIDAIIRNENEFVERLAGDIVQARDDEMPREQFETQFGNRIDLWANRFTETVNRARMHFGAKARLEWKLGATEEHCETCLALDGIIAFGYEWEEARLHPQMPPNELLGCQGWKCDCTLNPTTKRRSPRALDQLLTIAVGMKVGKSVKYDPNQPRVPAGDEHGGEWVGDRGGDDRDTEHQAAGLPAESKNESSVIEYFENHSSAKVVKNSQYDDVLGNKVDFVFEKSGVTIQTFIRETDNEVFLNDIKSSSSEDMTQQAGYSGLGYSVVRTMKDYSDKTGKKLIVPDATKPGMVFWDRITWLRRDYGVHIDVDGIDYNPPNTYSYDPKGRK